MVTIDYTILGMLSWKPMTGYDMKRMMQDSPVMYWSGNNNQIYKALVQLLDMGCVTNEVQYQESAPNKKVYSITDRGKAALEAWILETEPEIPEFKKAFLIQISWAGLMEKEKIDQLLARYEEQVREQIAMRQEEKRRQKYFPNRSEQEHYVWDQIYDNLCQSYEAELQWTVRFREGLKALK